MDKVRVLVTGASGFLGGHLCRNLIDRGYIVRSLVRKSSNYRHLEESGCDIVFGDLASGKGLDEAVNGMDIVYHIAAGWQVEGVSIQYFKDVNVIGTGKLLDASIKYKVKRFVHCSTVGVQGQIENPPANEEAPFRPGDHYQQTKLEGEKLVLTYLEKGLGVVVFRPVGIYGPGDLRFLKLFKPVSKGKWIVIGKADNLYHMTYVDDLVNGIILCGEKEGIEGEVFTLAGEGYRTVKELGLTIAKVLKRPLRIYHVPVMPVRVASYLCEVICRFFKIEPPIYRRRLDFFLKDRAFDITKAKRMLGYNPRVSLEQGVKLTVDWYRKNGYLI